MRVFVPVHFTPSLLPPPPYRKQPKTRPCVGKAYPPPPSSSLLVCMVFSMAPFMDWRDLPFPLVFFLPCVLASLFRVCVTICHCCRRRPLPCGLSCDPYELKPSCHPISPVSSTKNYLASLCCLPAHTSRIPALLSIRQLLNKWNRLVFNKSDNFRWGQPLVLPLTAADDWRLLITDDWWLITDYWLLITDSYWLLTTTCWRLWLLTTTDYWTCPSSVCW